MLQDQVCIYNERLKKEVFCICLDKIHILLYPGLVGNTLDQEHRGPTFDPKYRKVYNGLGDHLK